MSSPISIDTRIFTNTSHVCGKIGCVKPSRPRSQFLIWRALTGSQGRPANNRIINRNISQPRQEFCEIRKRSHNSWNAPIPAYISSVERFSFLLSFLKFVRNRAKVFVFNTKIFFLFANKNFFLPRFFCSFLQTVYKFVESLTNHFQSILIITCQRNIE